MPGNEHEIRDPIHVFVRLDSSERQVLNSRPFQRLRHIHQLALTYLVYPGATHRRFEHSLGVMELAGRVYDVVTSPNNISHDSIRNILPQSDFDREYWRRVIRMAALCHDVGHLPFSHAAERDLLPEGWDHERITLELINGEELESIWQDIMIQARHVAKLAVGPASYDGDFSDWEAILSEIIVGDAFGVDRIDYLLRDSHHTGVAYGKFDHYRLIDTLRILPKEEEGSTEPSLGIEEGGRHSAEALLLARYFMYTQVYFHPIRRVYDIHLKDFLKEWLSEGHFPIVISEHLSITDNEVNAGISEATRDEDYPGHDPAKRIVDRAHYRVLYERNPNDMQVNVEASKTVYEAVCREFGAENVRHDSYRQKSGVLDFPVHARDDRIMSSSALSDTLKNLPIVAVDYVFISPEKRENAETWLEENREDIIREGDEE